MLFLPSVASHLLRLNRKGEGILRNLPSSLVGRETLKLSKGSWAGSWWGERSMSSTPLPETLADSRSLAESRRTEMCRSLPLVLNQRVLNFKNRERLSWTS